MNGRSNQTPSASDTDTISLEDETLATSQSAIPRPSGAGEMKTAIRWITPIWGSHVIQETDTSQSQRKK